MLKIELGVITFVVSGLFIPVLSCRAAQNCLVWTVAAVWCVAVIRWLIPVIGAFQATHNLGCSAFSSEFVTTFGFVARLMAFYFAISQSVGLYLFTFIRFPVDVHSMSVCRSLFELTRCCFLNCNNTLLGGGRCYRSHGGMTPISSVDLSPRLGGTHSGQSTPRPHYCPPAVWLFTKTWTELELAFHLTD